MNQHGKNKGLYERFFKRLMDFTLSLLALILLSPILLLVAILVRIKLGSPVLFTQKRPGKDEKIFEMYKFRTMTNEKDKEGNLLPDSDRLTNFGRKLRSTSLDELPELINILKGEMSFIGPRPLATVYLSYYTDEERIRHSVKPGLTGLAQVNGRNASIWEERFKYDVEYSNQISFMNDLKIFFKTILVVLKRADIGERGVDAPMDFHIYRQQSVRGEVANNEYKRENRQS